MINLSRTIIKLCLLWLLVTVDSLPKTKQHTLCNSSIVPNNPEETKQYTHSELADIIHINCTHVHCDSSRMSLNMGQVAATDYFFEACLASCGILNTSEFYQFNDCYFHMQRFRDTLLPIFLKNHFVVEDTLFYSGMNGLMLIADQLYDHSEWKFIDNTSISAGILVKLTGDIDSSSLYRLLDNMRSTYPNTMRLTHLQLCIVSNLSSSFCDTIVDHFGDYFSSCEWFRVVGQYNYIYDALQFLLPDHWSQVKYIFTFDDKIKRLSHGWFANTFQAFHYRARIKDFGIVLITHDEYDGPNHENFFPAIAIDTLRIFEQPRHPSLWIRSKELLTVRQEVLEAFFSHPGLDTTSEFSVCLMIDVFSPFESARFVNTGLFLSLYNDYMHVTTVANYCHGRLSVSADYYMRRVEQLRRRTASWLSVVRQPDNPLLWTPSMFSYGQDDVFGSLLSTTETDALRTADDDSNKWRDDNNCEIEECSPERDDKIDPQLHQQHFALVASATKPRIAFITAIFGGYEFSPKKFARQTIPADFICFTDNLAMLSNGWILDGNPYHYTPSAAQQERFELDELALAVNYIRNNHHPFNIAKYYKTNFLEIPRLQGYDVVVWLDGSVRLHNERCAQIILDRIMKHGHNMIVFDATLEERLGRLGEEVQASVGCPKYSNKNWLNHVQPVQDVAAQYKAYLKNGYNDSGYWSAVQPLRPYYGLWVTCFVAYNMRLPDTKAMLNMWYDHVTFFTTQDQVSFPYVLQKLGLQPHSLPDRQVSSAPSPDVYIYGDFEWNNLFVKQNHGG